MKLLKTIEYAYENCTNWIPLFPNGLQNKSIKNNLEFDVVKYHKYRTYHIGGCYLYAFSKKNLSDTPVKYLQKEIVYIGQAGSSTHRGILNRTQDFVCTLKYGFEQKQPSEHAINFLARYGKHNVRHLYVCYIPIGFGETIKSDSLFFENLLLEDYSDLHGNFPILNRRLSALQKTVFMYESLKPKEQMSFNNQIRERFQKIFGNGFQK